MFVKGPVEGAAFSHWCPSVLVFCSLVGLLSLLYIPCFRPRFYWTANRIVHYIRRFDNCFVFVFVEPLFSRCHNLSLRIPSKFAISCVAMHIDPFSLHFSSCHRRSVFHCFQIVEMILV